MKRTQLLQETRKMHFEEILNLWTESRLTQEEAARMLCVSDRTFRRYIDRYHHGGLDGLLDKNSGDTAINSRQPLVPAFASATFGQAPLPA